MDRVVMALLASLLKLAASGRSCHWSGNRSTTEVQRFLLEIHRMWPPLSCLLKLQGVASSVDPRSVDLSNLSFFFFSLSLLPPSCKKSCFLSMWMKSLWMRLGHLSSNSIVLWWSFINIPEMSERAYGC